MIPHLRRGEIQRERQEIHHAPNRQDDGALAVQALSADHPHKQIPGVLCAHPVKVNRLGVTQRVQLRHTACDYNGAIRQRTQERSKVGVVAFVHRAVQERKDASPAKQCTQCIGARVQVVYPAHVAAILACPRRQRLGGTHSGQVHRQHAVGEGIALPVSNVYRQRAFAQAAHAVQPMDERLRAVRQRSGQLCNLRFASNKDIQIAWNLERRARNRQLESLDEQIHQRARDRIFQLRDGLELGRTELAAVEIKHTFEECFLRRILLFGCQKFLDEY